MDEIRIVVVEPNKPAYVKTVRNELEVLQGIVGGYIEAVPVYWEGLYLICNEDGKFDNLPPNRRIGADIIHGTFLFVGSDGEEFASLSELEVHELEKQFDVVDWGHRR